MKLSCKGLTTLVVVIWCASALLAQSAAVPDAPMPASPASQGKKTLLLPTPDSMPLAPSYAPSDLGDAANAKASTAKQVCGGEPSGTYTTANMKVPLELRGQVRVYEANVFSRVLSNWNRKYKAYAQSSAFSRGTVVVTRVAIRPDGSYVQPEITHSSGSRVEDDKAIAAIRDNDAFPPPPAGIGHPVVICMRFGYNIDLEDMNPNDGEKWLKEKKP